MKNYKLCTVLLALVLSVGCKSERPEFGDPGQQGAAGETSDAGGKDSSTSTDAGPVKPPTLGDGGKASGAKDCNAEEKLCSGRCVAISDPAYGCGDDTCDASACPSQTTGATLACEDGECVIDSCPTDYKKCGNQCVAVADPTYGCGETSCDATACPAAGAGTLVCQGGACVVGECGANTKKCDDKCVTTDANNGCADAARCTACADNEECVGSPTTCQCVPTGETMACSGKSCGTVSDGCGGMYTCGSCTLMSALVCVNGACKQCVEFTDCPAKSFDCSNNKCTCRAPASANVIKDGGFDIADVLSNWSTSDATWSTSDADECPGSGSVMFVDTFSRCFAVNGEGDYTLGLSYKQTDGSSWGCLGRFYQDRNCTQGTGPSFLNLGAGDDSGTWRSSVARAPAPEGTLSILVECDGVANLQVDQIYLRETGPTGSGF